MRRPQLLIGGYVRRTYDRLTTPPGWPIAVLLLVSVLADAVFLRPLLGPEPLVAVVWVLYLSQVGLAAIWLAMGRSPFPLRIVLAMFVWLAWVCLTSKMNSGPWPMTRLMLATVAVPLLASRALGLRLVRVGEDCPWPDVVFGLRRWQFSIGQMLGLTTAVAIVLGTMKSMRVPFYADTINSNPVIVALAAGQGLLAWASLWAGLGNRRGILRAVVVAVAAAAAFRTSSVAAGGPNVDRFLFAIFSLETVLLLASLWVFRLVGYRVVFRGGTIPEPPARFLFSTASARGGRNPGAWSACCFW